MLGASPSVLTIGCSGVGYMNGWRRRCMKVNCYSNRSLPFGLFLSTFSRYQTILVMDKFQEESLS